MVNFSEYISGLIKTLNGLNITNNPLEFPPVSIIEKGTAEILKFLREMIQAKSSGRHLNGSKYTYNEQIELVQAFRFMVGPIVP